MFQQWEQQLAARGYVTVRGGPLHPLISLSVSVPLLILGTLFLIRGALAGDPFEAALGMFVVMMFLLLAALMLFLLIRPSSITVNQYGILLDNGAWLPWQEVGLVTTAQWIFYSGVSFHLSPAGEQLTKHQVPPGKRWRKLLNPYSTTGTYPISLTIGPTEELCAWLQLMHQRHLGQAPPPQSAPPHAPGPQSPQAHPPQ